MVLTRRTASRTLAVAAGLLALAAASHPAPAQEPARPARAPRPATGTARITGRVAESQEPGGAWIGIGLSCWDCSLNSAGKSIPRWTFTAPPVVYSVDRGGPADAAGLRTGDSLVEIDGRAFVSREGGEAFANLRPGVATRLTYRRDGRERTVSVTPVENPLSREHTAADLQYREAARAYARSTAEAQRALRESSRTRAEESERARRDLTRLQGVFRSSRGKVLSDTSLQRIQEYLNQAQRALRWAPGNVVVPPAPQPPSYVVSPGGAAPRRGLIR